MENLEIYLDYIGEDSYVYRYDYTSKRYYNTGISLKGNPGNPGRPGKEGKSPHIGENGNWFIGEKDTGVKASGDTGPYKIGVLGNAQETEYYTQEEADAYNLENGLSEGDPGFVTTETVKNPAVLHTVKSYVDKQIENLIGTAPYTPTLQSAPTTSTTTYTKDGQTVDFVVGQFARVADANNPTGYDMYQLYDLTTSNDVTTAAWRSMDTVIGDINIILDTINGEVI